MRAGRLSASLHGDGRATPGDQSTSLGPARRRVRQHALHRMFAEPSSGGEEQMQARMKNPALVLGAMEPVQGLFKAVYAGGVDPATVELVHLRVSQINGCSACVGSGVKAARKAGETEERLATVAAWREAPYFSDAERATGPLGGSAALLGPLWAGFGIGATTGGIIAGLARRLPVWPALVAAVIGRGAPRSPCWACCGRPPSLWPASPPAAAV